MFRRNTLFLLAGLALVGVATGVLGADLKTSTATRGTLTTSDSLSTSTTGTRTTSLSTSGFQDIIYDYDVYTSDPVEWAWWVRYYYHDGYEDVGPFWHYREAEDHLEQAPAEVNGAYYAEIVEHDTELDFRFYERFDTYAEAAFWATMLEYDGKVVEIRRYSDIVYVMDDPVLNADW